MNDPSASVVHHPAETELFEDTLSCDLAMPAEFTLGTGVVRPGAAESLLRSVALIEDSRGSEENEERSESNLQIQRLEARLDVALMLLGKLVRQQSDALPVRPVRWSKRGLRLEVGAQHAATVGNQGIVRLQPSDWLPDCVELPATLLAVASNGQGANYLWLRHEFQGDAIEMAVERHLFRVHRRQVAATRRQR